MTEAEYNAGEYPAAAEPVTETVSAEERFAQLKAYYEDKLAEADRASIKMFTLGFVVGICLMMGVLAGVVTK